MLRFHVVSPWTRLYIMPLGVEMVNMLTPARGNCQVVGIEMRENAINTWEFLKVQYTLRLTNTEVESLLRVKENRLPRETMPC